MLYSFFTNEVEICPVFIKSCIQDYLIDMVFYGSTASSCVPFLYIRIIQIFIKNLLLYDLTVNQSFSGIFYKNPYRYSFVNFENVASFLHSIYLLNEKKGEKMKFIKNEGPESRGKGWQVMMEEKEREVKGNGASNTGRPVI